MNDDKPQKLDYRSPRHDSAPADSLTFLDLFLAVGRRLLFAFGIGLFCGGLGRAFSSNDIPAEMMGWGGALAALFAPLPWNR